jgi:hypothetical protein
MLFTKFKGTLSQEEEEVGQQKEQADQAKAKQGRKGK